MRRVLKPMFLCLWLLAAWAFGANLRAQTQPLAPMHVGTRVISGDVLSLKTGMPIEDAEVTLSSTRDRKLVAETTTDAQGRFSFSGLADGKYSLRASRRGYIAASFEEHAGGVSTAIVTGPDLVSTGLRFMLAPPAVIYGTVMEDSGDPVPRARISLYRPNPRSGTGKMVRAAVTNADPMGNYEFPHLATGTYYLCVVAKPWYAANGRVMRDAQNGAGSEQSRSLLDVAYATTCYPGVTESSSAEPILVNGGDRVSVNVTMHPVPATHISMQVPSPESGRSISMPQLHEDVFGFSEFVQPAVSFFRHESGNDGNAIHTIEIGGVAPGRYEVDFGAQSGEASRLTTIDASSEHASLDASSAAALADVSGSVAMAGGGSLAPGLFIALAPQQGTEVRSARVETNGSFNIQAVRPGDYEITVNAAGYPLSVTHLTAKGATVSRNLLRVGSEAVELTAMAAEAMASVDGFVKRDGKPAPGVFVVLVPADPAAGEEAWRPNQSDSDGSFDFPNVIPGEYTLAAIEEGWTLDWARADVIARYLPKGLKVTVPPHSRVIHLSEAVEAQMK